MYQSNELPIQSVDVPMSAIKTLATISQLVKIHPKNKYCACCCDALFAQFASQPTLFGVTSSYSVDNHHLRTHVFMSANQDKS